MKVAECVVDGVRYRRYKAKGIWAWIEDCGGCVGNDDRDLCRRLDSCGSLDNDGWEDFIWKKVEKYVDKKLKK